MASRPSASSCFKATLVFLMLAGCAASPPADPPVEGPAPAAETLFAFAPSVAVPVPNTQKEAFVEVSADGQTVLACAHGDFTAPAHMYASVDGGVTFRELDAGAAATMPAGDCDVALGPGGAWSFAGKTAAGVTVASTTDAGRTWVVNHLAAPPLNGLADRQWLAYVGSTLLLSYQPGSQQAGSVYVARSTDLGATWTAPAEVAQPEPALPGINVGSFLVGPGAQDVRIPVLRAPLLPTGPGRLSLLVSTDAGEAWTEVPVGPADERAYPTGAAVTRDGTLAWAYSEGEQLVLIASTDGGASWSEPVAVANGLAWPRPWASARPDGTVDIVWLSDGTDFGRGVGLAVTRVDPRLAEPVLAAAIVADVGFIEFAAVAHDGLGRAHVVAIDAPRIVDGDPGQSGNLLVVQEQGPASADPQPLK